MGSLDAIRVVAAVLESYMNVCGGSIGALARRLGLPADAVIVLHDELNLPPGKIKGAGEEQRRSQRAQVVRQHHRRHLLAGPDRHRDRPADRRDASDFVFSAIPPTSWPRCAWRRWGGWRRCSPMGRAG
jgi:peptidyl-tRNA hydrolase